MWTWNKTKLILVAAGLCFVSPTSAKACNPLNPICLFKMLLKATPGLPVMDFVSIPAVIPHIPTALVNEAQVKVKEAGDKILTDLRSGKIPSASSINLKPNLPKFEQKPAGQGSSSLEGLPSMDRADPIAVAKAIEPLFIRPGGDPDVPMSRHDKNLMEYQRHQFDYNNQLEVAGYLAEKQAKLKDVSVFADHVKNQMESAKNLNDAYRANFAAHHMEYTLMIIYNQLLAAGLQMDMSNTLVQYAPVLDGPIFGK